MREAPSRVLIDALLEAGAKVEAHDPEAMEVAKEIYGALKPHCTVFYDEKGAVGRRYRRQDEAGTPYCITVDGDSLKDKSVTLRDRDTLEQTRIKIDDCVDEILTRLK